MTCGLSDNELFILNMLYKRRNLKSNAGLNSKLMCKIYVKKFPDNFEDVIRNLIHTGYVGPIKKKDMKYYIYDIPKTIAALKIHGHNVVLGRERPL